MQHNTATPLKCRVKLYQVGDLGEWIDKGIAHVHCEINYQKNQGLVVAQSESSDEDLLSIPISNDDGVQFTMQNDIIVWKDALKRETAFSFQNSDECLMIWNEIEKMQKVTVNQECNEESLTVVVLDETIESKLLQGNSINKFIKFKSLEMIKSYSLEEMNTPETIAIYIEEGKIVIGDTYMGKIAVIDISNDEKKFVEFKGFPFFPFQIYIENGYKKDGKQSYGSALLFYCFDQGIQKHDMKHLLNPNNEWDSSSAIWKLNESSGSMIIDENRGAVHVFPHYEFLSAHVPVVFPENTSFDLETGAKLNDNFKITKKIFTLPVFGPDNSVFIHDGNTIEKLILTDGEYSNKNIGYRSLKKEGVYSLYYDKELTGLLFVIGKDYISVLDTNLIEKYHYLIDFVCKQIAIKKETSELFALDINKVLKIYKINSVD